MASRLQDEEIDQHHGGRLFEVDRESLEDVELHMLSTTLKFNTTYFFIPREQPLELLDLKIMFSLLQKRSGVQESNGDEADQDTLPFEAFQRAFERLFYVMQDPVQFDGLAYDDNGDGFVSWGEFFRVYKKRNIKVHLTLCERIYLTFDNPESSGMAQVVSVLLLFTIMLSSLCFVWSTTPKCHIDPDDCRGLESIEKFCLLVFVIEFMSRVCTVWAVRMEVHDKAKLEELVVGWEPIVLPTPWQRLLRFMWTPANVIDIAAILPGVIGLWADADGGAFLVLRLIRLTRIFRAFKSPALVAPVIVIGRTLEKSTKALEVLAFNLSLGIVIFGALLYMVEGGDDLKAFGLGGQWNETSHYYDRPVDVTWDGEEWITVWQQSPFQSIPEAFWWAMVTVATVGYGDHAPTTMTGYSIATFLMLFSMLILALPVGVMGGTFTQEWEAFQSEKHEKAEMQQKEMQYITRAIKTLDPGKLARLLLIEVWHDHPCMPTKEGSRPPSSTFLGEAKLFLDLHKDKAECKEVRIRLEDNHDIVKRSITGSVCVRYEWTPHTHAKASLLAFEGAASGEESTNTMGARRSQNCGDDLDLHGSLTVTIIRADKLINLDNFNGVSSPYVTLLCYPTYTPSNGPMSVSWRMPTVRNKLSPAWNSSHTFIYNWSEDEDVKAMTDHCMIQECDRSGAMGSVKQRRSRSGIHSGGGASATSATQSLKLEEALTALLDVSAELRSQRSEMKQVRDEARGLCKHKNCSHCSNHRGRSPDSQDRRREDTEDSGSRSPRRAFEGSRTFTDGLDSRDDDEQSCEKTSTNGGANSRNRSGAGTNSPSSVLLPGMLGD